MSGYDPGGGPAGGSRGSTPDLSSLQENFNQQQAKITALRELVRQTETAQGKKNASAQEKVKNIAQRLTQYKTKATKSRLSRASSSEVHPDLIATRINEEGGDLEYEDTTANYEEQQHMSLPAIPTVPRGRSETPGSEKFNLLRQQMEQNRLKMAARESHKREMEERVIELKHKLESTQQTLERSVEFGRSTGDLTLLAPGKLTRSEFNKSTSDLTQLAGIGYAAFSNFDVERLKYLEGRVKVLEQELTNKENIPVKDGLVEDLQRKILDLEEALKEKECVIEARTQAVSLMTENLAMKGKNTVDLLEDTKQEMFRMQTNFVQAESNLKAELDRLQVELDEKNSKISNLEEMNNILETARYDLTVENSSLKQKLEDVQDFSTKISELNKLNQSLQHRITELESQKYEFITDAEAEQAKFGESDEKYRELLDRIQELEEELNKKVAPEEVLLEKIRSLEATIEAQNEQIESYKEQHAELQESIQEKTVELNVLNANFSVLQEKLKTAGPKPLFPKSPEEEAEVENSKLKQQLDEANKSMIKTKLKIKQLQKQVDSFKKTSVVHEEVVRLTEEVQTLTQRLAEVEEEKGNLQLHLVNYDGSLPDSELEKRIKILETTCQNQTTAIQLLEEQKLDMCEDLNSTKHELEAMRDQVKELDQTEQSGRISCQMSSIEFEEKLERCVSEREDLSRQLKKVEEEKLELQQKLDRYMVENIELLDKIEKLSLEKVSSAESIEIVEGLTLKEKREIECFETSKTKEACGVIDETDRSSHHKSEEEHDSEHHTSTDSDEDLNVSLSKLREESSELMHKIELFTNERREVLEKLEALTLENQAYLEELDRLRSDHRELLEEHATMKESEIVLKRTLEQIESEKAEIVKEFEAAKGLKAKLESESSAPSSSHSSPAKSPTLSIDRDSFEQALRSVDNEVSNYNKNKDKNKKLQISKKLSTDAKCLQKMANNLLEEYCKNVKECEIMRAELEQLKEKVSHSLPQEESNEIEYLKAQIIEMTHAQIEKVEYIDRLKEEIQEKNVEIAELKREIESTRDAEKSSDDEPELLKVELNSKNDEIRDLKKELDALEAKKSDEIGDLQTKFSAANKEIDILKELVAEQKLQLIEAYREHETEIASKMKEMQNLENEAQKMKDELDNLNKKVSDNAIKYSEELNLQLSQLRSIIEEQKEEISHKQETIDSLNNQIIDLYKTMEENANKIIEKEDEMQYLQELLDAKKDEIQMMHEKLAASQRSLDQLRRQLEETLAKPTIPQVVVDESRIQELEIKNQELDVKNKELLEKLKKFAANLKKKNAQCQDLEDKLSSSLHEIEELKKSSVSAASLGASAEELKEENEELSQRLHHLNNELHKLLQQKYQLESEKQTAHSNVTELQEKINSMEVTLQESLAKLQSTEAELNDRSKQFEIVQEDLDSKNVKIEKCKAIIKEKNKEIQRLQEHERKTAHLEDELKMSQSKLVDFHNQTLMLGKLKADKEEINATMKVEAERSKTLEQEMSHQAEQIRKLEVNLEMQEEENRNLKQQIVKLEQGISLVEERRNSLERQKMLLGDKLEEKSQEFMKHEDELMHRIANLSQHDEAVECKLKEKEEELLDLGNRLKDAEHQKDQLRTTLSQVELQLADQEEACKRLVEMENENYSLKQEVTNLQTELKRTTVDTETKIAEKDVEIDQLEVELTNQLTRIENERKQLQENLERTRDKNNDLQDELVRLQESVNSLEQLRSDLEKEVTWLKMQNENLQQDSAELQELRMQIVQDQTELENLRAQADTVAQNHQCEINALRQQIADMEAIRTQLSQNQTDDQVIVQNEIIKLKDLLEQKQAEITYLQQQNLQLQMSASGPPEVDDPFTSIQRSSVPVLEERIRELENDATLKDSRIQELQIEKDLVECNVEELKKQLKILEQTVLKSEELHAHLVQKGSELEAKSKELFQTMPPVKQTHQATPENFGTAQFFTTPSDSTTVSLFGSVPEESGWGWQEPIATQHTHQTVNALPEGNEIKTLREEVTSLKQQNEAAAKQINELQNKLAALIDRDDEFYQLKDEIDILRAQNSSFSYELEQKSAKVKDIAEKLQIEQLRVCELEEQLRDKDVKVSTFFSQTPVFEEIVVPKKTYLCTPSTSVDFEELAIEEPALVSSAAHQQDAVPTEKCLNDHVLEQLRIENQAQVQTIADHVRSLEDLKLFNEQYRQQIDQYQQELQVLRTEHSRFENSMKDNKEALCAQQQQYEAQLEMLQKLHDQAQESEMLQKQAELAAIRDQHQHELSHLKEQLDLLKQRNEMHEQDRDSFLQLQDELDIVKAQNSSLLQEIQEKTDKIKRICQTLTEAENRICILEEQLTVTLSKEPAVTAASFFDNTQYGTREAVFEEIIQPKKAPTLQPAQQQTSNIIQLEDDCWGPEEAMLEAQHQQTSSVALERRISEKDDYIRQLELEKERLQQEITDLKVKSGKLLKKVKEYKAKCDQMERRSAFMETSELDLAIQEELNSQIKILEGKLQESKTEHEKDVAEKESLLKRVDVLVAANERFTEMKERQDVQIEMQLARIKELNAKLQQLEEWGEDNTTKKSMSTTQTDTDDENVEQLRARVQELQKEVQDLQVDNEELQALLEEEKTNIEILEKRLQQKDMEIQDLIEKLDGLSQDSRTIKSSLESLNQQKSQETVELSKQIKELMNKNNDLTQQIEKMRTESLFQSSEQEKELRFEIEQLNAVVQYKDAELLHLNERLQQQIREDQTESLVQEILSKNQEISSLKVRVQQLESDRQEMENNLTLQISKELASNRPEDKNSIRLVELERANNQLLEEKSQMELELQVLNDQVLHSLELEDRMKTMVLELDTKNIEIEALKSSLEMMKQTTATSSSSSEHSTPASGQQQPALEDDLQKQIQKLNKERSDLEANYRITLEQRDAHWAQVVEERGAQVAESWKQHVDQREAEFSSLEKNLRDEIARLKGEPASEAELELAEPISPSIEFSMVQKMKEALESQELEIVTLKEQLAIRSAEYARLAAQVDPFAVKHASNMVTNELKPQSVDNNNVLRAQLDYAMYMMYQRDMRCEELELELRNLLEERDALQLRLSNALRQHEEFKRKVTSHVGEPSGDSSDISNPITPEKTLQQIVQESGISAVNTSAAVPDLTNKLSELHSIGHAKDKRLQVEREERHRQLEEFQRDVANMPLEAAVKIAGTTLSQTESSNQQQSASTVLINWILGKKPDS